MPVIDGTVVRRNAKWINAVYRVDVEPLASRVLNDILADRDVTRAFIQVQSNLAVIFVDVIFSDQRSRACGEVVDCSAVRLEATTTSR